MATTTGIRVQASTLWELSTSSRNAAQQNETETTQLSNMLLSRVGADWAGVASAQFQQLWNDWHNAANEVQKALDGISMLLRQAGDAYESAEHSIANTFRAM